MWMAEVMLSRLLTWYNSCATTASTCRGVRRVKMPVGKSRIGRRNPTTPGSSRPGDRQTWAFVGIATVGISTGVLARTAARIRRQARNRINAIAPNPHIHRPTISRGRQSTVVRDVKGVEALTLGNGSVIFSIVNETEGVAICVAIWVTL